MPLFPPHQQTSTVEILMLLKWRQKEQNLGVVLTNLSHISGEEVVKFLQDTLDCLFEILNNNSDTYGDKVFDVLVSGCGHTTVTHRLCTRTPSHITCTHSHCHRHLIRTHTLTHHLHTQSKIVEVPHTVAKLVNGYNLHV